MSRIRLGDIAQARSGDKGDGSNVGVFVSNEADYELIRRVLTTDRVKAHFHGICFGTSSATSCPTCSR